MKSILEAVWPLNVCVRPHTSGTARDEKVGFTLIELLVTIVIIGILSSISLPVLSTSKEKARRTFCRNQIKQLIFTCHMYANDNREEFPSGLDNNNGPHSSSPSSGTNSHTINLSNITMGQIATYSGGTNILFCPKFKLGRILPYSEKYGYVIGYNHLAGHKFCTTNFLQYAAWISPRTATDDPRLEMVADPNHWATRDKWVMIPHGPSRAVTKRGAFDLSGGPNDWYSKADGGSVGCLDGSVAWRRRAAMLQHIASTHGDQYIGVW
jgi:prepilin-type N-terminal cleavage/methylation domain-containing protein